jgi:glycosyltransferase involved in cell wall biosynthesis
MEALIPLKPPGVRICHLTSVHPPLDARIFRKEISTLTSAGHSVTLIAPGDEDQLLDGVEVRGIKLAKNRRDRLLRTMWLVYQAAVRERADIYHFHDPELILVGLALKARGHHVIYDAHEKLPDSILGKDYIPRFLRKPVALAAGCVEIVGAAFFDRVVAATPAIAARFPSDKTVTVQNFPVLSEIREQHVKPYDERSHLVVYIGSITKMRGIQEVVEAIGMLPTDLDARLALAGEFYPTTLADWVRNARAGSRVNILGWVDGPGVARLLGEARIGLVTLHPTAAYLKAQPTKLFEYMAAGIPVVASNFPLWEDVIKSNGCGLTVDPTNPESIAEAIVYLLSNPAEAQEMGRRGQALAFERFSWATEGAKLLSMYAAVHPSA